MTRAGAVVVILIIGLARAAGAQPQDTIADILIHGNHTTPDADILTIGGLARGEPAADERLRGAERRLRESGRFASVEIRRRFASIGDPSAILVIVVVDEHPGISDGDLTPGPLARLRSAAVWLPIVDHSDGYGLTYGARVSLIDALGDRSRISVPMTWGGERRVALEAERALGTAPVLLLGSVSLRRRVNPHYDVADLRTELRVQAERPLASWLRAGADARVANVDFGDAYDGRHGAAGVHATIDTRIDPSFPRDAVLARIGWEHAWYGDQAPASAAAARSGGSGLWTTDARAFVGLWGRPVLALRIQASTSPARLPRSEQALLGGSDSLRGYRAGHRAGDNLMAASAEVRVPLSSPLRIGRLGLKTFVDTGAAWMSGERLRDQRFDRGVGGGLYFGAAAILADADIAWPEHGKPRVHVGLGVSF